MSKKYLLITFFLWGVILGLSQCTNSAPKDNTVIAKSSQDSIQLLTQGFQLLESNCFTCHSPKGNIANRLAPPMEAVKRHYLESEPSLPQFISAITSFVQEPDTSKSKMPNALQRFGLMPKMEFSKEDLQAMAYYMYNVELEQPDWFDEHYQEERSKYLQKEKMSDLSYEQLGRRYAMRTKSVLGKNLLSAINSRGTEHALSFCNTAAYPLTDSMARVLNAEIKRVSDKPRNPKNTANEDQLAYIRNAKVQLKAGQEISPKVQEINNKMVAYYPIMTNQMCLQCHGDPAKDINKATLAMINDLYPEDSAINYGPNQMRGIWVVQMGKK